MDELERLDFEKLIETINRQLGKERYKVHVTSVSNTNIKLLMTTTVGNLLNLASTIMNYIAKKVETDPTIYLQFSGFFIGAAIATITTGIVLMAPQMRREFKQQDVSNELLQFSNKVLQKEAESIETCYSNRCDKPDNYTPAEFYTFLMDAFRKANKVKEEEFLLSYDDIEYVKQTTEEFKKQKVKTADQLFEYYKQKRFPQ